ncbi:MAG: peptidoglycan glycosyltransferase, partial [Clostridiales bacterium]|nr:peptidoglycan glycosyltransferase [Clostridiales bacterium]
MFRTKTMHRRNIVVFFFIATICGIILTSRLVYLMVNKAEYYSQKADELHERERSIKAARGKIYDATGTLIATNRTVCTISVIYNQVKDKEIVISVLVKELGIDEETIRKKVEKVSSREKIKSNVDKEIGDRIREYDLAGVKVDEDFKRYYPFGTLASKVLGFTGSDNQGIIGLEVKYEDYLKGIDGQILTKTDARGIELENTAEERIDPISGNSLHISLDINIQEYAGQAALKVLEKKEAKSVSIIAMNPKNGQIKAMVNLPEFDLNDPFTLNYQLNEEVDEKKRQDLLNQMWRNGAINDTYEPGSTFKIITMAGSIEEEVVTLEDSFFCPGYKIVDDRKIRCHKVIGHGSETFLQGALNSCNPVFVEIGLRLGIDNTYKYFKQLGLLEKTGIDLPGEANTIMHKKENMGQVELATVSFGQSFQITPIQMISTVSAIINGGTKVTPHFGVEVRNSDGKTIETFEYKTKENVISIETSDMVKYILEKVVSEGTGKRAYIEGYEIGGKTATSEKLPRRNGKYISSFIGFAPADDPEIVIIVIVDEPVGIYYGGTVAAPVAREIFENILPYLGLAQNLIE